LHEDLSDGKSSGCCSCSFKDTPEIKALNETLEAIKNARSVNIKKEDAQYFTPGTMNLLTEGPVTFTDDPSANKVIVLNY
jgi:hypothetical protein